LARPQQLHAGRSASFPRHTALRVTPEQTGWSVPATARTDPDKPCNSPNTRPELWPCIRCSTAIVSGQKRPFRESASGPEATRSSDEGRSPPTFRLQPVESKRFIISCRVWQQFPHRLNRLRPNRVPPRLRESPHHASNCGTASATELRC
jgi:hypothetical protein